MPDQSQQRWVQLAACVLLAALMGATARAQELTGIARAGKPSLGNSPKPNPLQRAGSAMGEAATSFSNGVKGIFAKKGQQDGPTPRPDAKPLDADFHVSMAQLHERSGQAASAEAEYRKALKLKRNHLTAMLGYGRLLDREERHAEAIDLYRKAAQHHPKEPSLYNDLGLSYGHMGRHAEAIAALEKAVSLEPNKKLYRNNLASVLVKTNQPEEAYKHLAAVHPQAVARYNVGYLLTQQNERRLAYRYFDEALALDPQLAAAREWRDILAPSVLGAPPSESPGALLAETDRRSPAPPAVAAPPANRDPQVRSETPEVAPSNRNQAIAAAAQDPMEQRDRIVGVPLPARNRAPATEPPREGRYPTLDGAAPANSRRTAAVEPNRMERDRIDSARTDAGGAAPLPEAGNDEDSIAHGADPLSAPAAESIGGAPRSADPPRPSPQVARENEKEPRRPVYLAPSRY